MTSSQYQPLISGVPSKESKKKSSHRNSYEGKHDDGVAPMLFKVSDKNSQTKNNTVWGVNITHQVTKPGNRLCTDQLLHAYRTSLQAVFFAPIHYSNFSQMWECADAEIVADNGCKVGTKKLTTLRQVVPPEMTLEQRVEIGIRCVLEIYREPFFVEWARKFLSGEDRSLGAVDAANESAWAGGETDPKKKRDAIEVAKVAAYHCKETNEQWSNWVTSGMAAAASAAWVSTAAFCLLKAREDTDSSEKEDLSDRSAYPEYVAFEAAWAVEAAAGAAPGKFRPSEIIEQVCNNERK